MYLPSKCLTGLSKVNAKYKTTQDPILGRWCDSDLPLLCCYYLLDYIHVLKRGSPFPNCNLRGVPPDVPPASPAQSLYLPTEEFCYQVRQDQGVVPSVVPEVPAVLGRQPGSESKRGRHKAGSPACSGCHHRWCHQLMLLPCAALTAWTVSIESFFGLVWFLVLLGFFFRQWKSQRGWINNVVGKVFLFLNRVMLWPRLFWVRGTCTTGIFIQTPGPSVTQGMGQAHKDYKMTSNRQRKEPWGRSGCGQRESAEVTVHTFMHPL